MKFVAPKVLFLPYKHNDTRKLLSTFSDGCDFSCWMKTFVLIFPLLRQDPTFKTGGLYSARKGNRLMHSPFYLVIKFFGILALNISNEVQLMFTISPVTHEKMVLDGLPNNFPRFFKYFPPTNQLTHTQSYFNKLCTNIKLSLSVKFEAFWIMYQKFENWTAACDHFVSYPMRNSIHRYILSQM